MWGGDDQDLQPVFRLSWSHGLRKSSALYAFAGSGRLLELSEFHLKQFGFLPYFVIVLSQKSPSAHFRSFVETRGGGTQ